ncbi:DUF1080 domain-containing protein [Lentisphaera marina]|uniref:family 16 glycoside hydrolase n=1 Tax=Lentisphaera marina TaxID=1111041 RepID=UPI0023670976|nr:family 16 glycoside hydrolase [Lentisphaera marina]MDD7983498.1 DUF1080 domain-containing protein [Lentisphaera marina]
MKIKASKRHFYTALLTLCTVAHGQAPHEIYEAEDAKRERVTNENNHAGFSGTGFAAGFYNNNKGILTFKVKAPKAGKQDITLRYSAGYGNAEIILGVNGETQDLSIPGTGSWKVWSDIFIPVTLKKGENTITVKMKHSTTKCLNIDYLAMGKLKASENSSQAVNESTEKTLRDAFFNPRGWENIADAKAEGRKLIVTEEGTGLIINGRKGKTNNISTKKHYKDIEFHLEFMLAEKSNAGVYFMGRYEIQILDSYGKEKWGFDVLGGLYQRWPPERGAGVAAKVNAAKKPGEWQTMDAIFRAPRFDETGRRISQAYFKEVKINGQLVQENLYAVGPTRSSQFNDEAATGPIMIQGDHGPIVIRKMTVKEIDLEDIQTKELNADEKRPLGKNGDPMVEMIAMGKDIFQNKGCMECHNTRTDNSIVKTGPAIYGIFQKKPVSIKVMESAERHLVNLPADKAYLYQSLREPTAHLSLNKNDGDKPYLPIMPPFTPETLKDSEIEALYHYLLTLNEDQNAGPKISWHSKPSDQYNIWKDRGSVIVQNRPRIQRTHIPGTSARSYFVGLPGNLNYTFDPRTMGISMIWNGPFVTINGMMNGRGKPSRIGDKGIKWTQGTTDFFTPYLSNGKLLDKSWAEPAKADYHYVYKTLHFEGDYLEEAAKIDSKFISVNTVKNEIPKFNYEVEGNQLELIFSVNKNNSINAKFNMNLKRDLSLHIPTSNFTDFKASLGKIEADKWTIPAGNHKAITFTAKRKAKFQKVHTAGVNSAPNENLKGQKIKWSKAPEKEQQKAEMDPAYTLHNAEAPTDIHGRKQLFEPLGIEFLNKDIAFVTTRTAGIWKVVNGEWFLFSEGHYDSLSLVIESENSVVIGEKPGLTRLIDTDGDNWSDKRENVSDHFRFCGNYHEYLHGPIPYKGGYLYNLNLTHNLPFNYKAGGAFMGTGGGLKGWMCYVDKDGKFSTFANGFRSPAGLSLSPDKEIIYTENQGEYVGTSKIFKVEEGKFYGNPTGLVDLPGLTFKSKEIQWDSVKDGREQAIILLPHNKVMNAPGNPTWDLTKGAFGPFKGQMFLGDQTQSCIYRVATETVNGIEQGVVLPFANKMASGVMRLTFNPNDNSLWVGQTGRGWRAQGGAESSLQKISFNGETPNAIQTVKITPQGFDIHFIKEQNSANFGNINISSWYYIDSPGYGSPEKGGRKEALSSVNWSSDKKTCSIKFEDFKLDEASDSGHTSRVYYLDLTQTSFGKSVGPFLSKAYYTLNAIPK